MSKFEIALYSAGIFFIGALNAVMTYWALVLVYGGENVITAKTIYNLADRADWESPVTVDGKEIDEVTLVYDETERVVRMDIRTKKMTEQPSD